MKTITRTKIFFTATLLLAGCSGQPNPEDLSADAGNGPIYIKIGTGWYRYDHVMGMQLDVPDLDLRQLDNDRFVYMRMRGNDAPPLEGIIALDGTMILPAIYDKVYDYSEGLSAVQKDGKWFFVDKDGESVIDKKFAQVRSFHNGRAWTSEGFINMAGKVVIGEPYYLLANDFSGNLSRITENGLYGYMDLNGKVVIKPQYKMAGDFHEGLAWVYVEEDNKQKYGYIDKTGSMVICAIFDYAEDFKFGMARVMIGNDGFCINHEGQNISDHPVDPHSLAQNE